MKRVVFAFFCILISFAGLAQQRYVTLYSECNYSGRASKLYPGRYELSNENVGAYNLSSMRVPYGLKIVIYSGGSPGTGNKTNFVHDVDCLGYDWNDKTGAVVVEEMDENANSGYNYSNNRAPKQPSYHDVVTLFDNCNMTGNSVTLGEGWYNTDNIANVGNDRVSAISIPSGWTVIAYVDKNWSGSSQTFTRSVNCLPANFNDKISSLKIIPPYGGNNNQGGNYNNNNNNYNNNNNNNNYRQDNDYHNNNATGVNIYSDGWFGGNHKKFTPGAYDLRGSEFDKSISSLNVDAGFEVVLFDQYDFGGQSFKLTYSALNLNAYHWNDRVRSFIVRRVN